MPKGFANYQTKIQPKKKTLGAERMISWSPWPPANFQTKYPGFPLVMTIFLLILGQVYISSVK